MRDVATKNSLEQIPLSMLSGGGNNNVGDYFEKETVLSEMLNCRCLQKLIYFLHCVKKYVPKSSKVEL